jgi:hypothetical protein
MSMPARNCNRETWVKPEPRIYEPVGAKAFEFKTKDVVISYQPNIEGSGMNFEFVNLSKRPLKIIWDESLFVESSGQTTQVFHSGINIKDRAQSQIPSIVLPGSKFNDEIIPISRIEISPAPQFGLWAYHPICGSKTKNWELDAKICEGQTFGYFITYEIGSKKKTAQVKFKYIGLKSPPAPAAAAAR